MQRALTGGCLTIGLNHMLPHNGSFVILAEMRAAGTIRRLGKQQDGKMRMRRYGDFDNPQEACIAALRMGNDN